MSDLLPTVGWREWAGLPDLKIRRVKVKVDTGARSSSLHALNIEEFHRDGQDFVRFDVQPRQRSERRQVVCEAPVLEFRQIRSSNGKVQRRPVIRTTLALLDQQFSVDLTLTDRSKMGFRMLVGREALRSRFVVDAAGSFLGGRRLSKSSRSSEADDSTKDSE